MGLQPAGPSGNSPAQRRIGADSDVWKSLKDSKKPKEYQKKVVCAPQVLICLASPVPLAQHQAPLASAATFIFTWGGHVPVTRAVLQVNGSMQGQHQNVWPPCLHLGCRRTARERPGP